MKAFFSSLQTNRSKYVGGNNNSSSNSPSGNPGSVPGLQLSTDSSSPTATSGNNITSQPMKSPRNRKGSQNNPKFVSSLKLDNSNLVPFIDILEETVKQKVQHPNIILKITDNPQVINIVNDFANGLCTKYSLESQEFSDLWSAIVKIIQISDPILTAANCDTLQHLDSGPLPTETSATIISRLPVFHQRLLGALFSACDMLIRLDANVASALASSASNALIWNSAPNSPENKLAFTSFVRHCSENFPYYFTFANRIGLSVKPVESKEWMAILTEGNSGVIIGNSAALNPNYSHNNPNNNPISPSNSLMQSIDLSSTTTAAVTDKTRSSSSSLPPRNREGDNNGMMTTTTMGGRDRGGERERGGGGSGGGGGGLGLSLELFDKRSNTPNNMSLASSSSRDSNYSPAATMMISNNNSNSNTKEDGEPTLPRKGIAMKPSNENIHNNNSSSNNNNNTNNKNNNNSNNRATEGRISSEDDWDEEQQQEEENNNNNNMRNNNKKETPAPAAAPPAPKTVKLKDLQNVFSSSLVSASSLEYRSFRNIDYNEDYADLK
jgi:hypothetical protein